MLSRVNVLLNGELVAADRARVGVFDRGFLFGDGVYEGLRAFDGHLVALGRHEQRLRAGLAEARIPWDARGLGEVCRRVLKGNGLRDAFVYVQVTRGEPAAGEPVRARLLTGPVRPTVFAYAVPAPGLDACDQPASRTAGLLRDTRWLRGACKSISLLGSVLGAVEAAERGCEDAIFVRDGLVAEATASNVLAALPSGAPGAGTGGASAIPGVALVTPDLRSTPILEGVTRAILLGAGLGIVERPLRAEELAVAREVMLLGTMSMVTAVTALDGRPVGDGRIGPVARRVLAVLVGEIRREMAAGSGACRG